jgi:hypothetical protein
MLALYLNEQRAHAPQQSNTDWMVVDKSPRSAVFADYPAQYDLIVAGQAMLVQQFSDGMVAGWSKASRNAGLRRGRAHKAALTPRSKGQTEAIQ